MAILHERFKLWKTTFIYVCWLKPFTIQFCTNISTFQINNCLAAISLLQNTISSQMYNNMELINSRYVENAARGTHVTTN